MRDAGEFEQSLRAEGFTQVETKGVPASTHNDEHSHPFEVRALVLEGEITLTVAGASRTYAQGDVFAMAAGCRHVEDIGGAGVRYLVGRRTPA